MPLYRLRCKACEHEFETLIGNQLAEADDDHCPKCRGETNIVPSSTASLPYTSKTLMAERDDAVVAYRHSMESPATRAKLEKHDRGEPGGLSIVHRSEIDADASPELDL